MADASMGGTALPICLYRLDGYPANRNRSGKVCILAASRIESVRSCLGWMYQYPSFAIWAVIVLDSPSQESLKYLSLNMSNRYLLRCSGTSRYPSPCRMRRYILASSGRTARVM